ncbi:MAG TPA: tetratricopeptide repeat protein [Polyangiaceae bacterium]|nr:tetratricopeptide repeat protein [Polyangiaceae bacterium]
MTRVRASAGLSTNFGFAVLFCGVFCLCLTASTDGDVFWHLAAGREILKRGALLSVDVFSLSASGRPWIDVHWLFQVICAWGYALGGLRALVFGKAIIVASGALLPGQVVRRRAGAAALPLFIVVLFAALLAARDLLLLRPTIFTLLFLAAFIHTIEFARADGTPRRLWLLPLIQVAWVNVQGLFALGPSVIFAYWLGWELEARFGRASWFPFASAAGSGSDGQMRRGLAFALASSLFACLVNPFGFRAVLLPTELLRRLTPGHANSFSNEIAENVPPFILEQQTGQFWHLKWFLLALAVVVLVAGRRLRASHGILVGGFAFLALIANRNVLLLYWVATPLAASYLFMGLRRRLPRIRSVHVSLRAATYASVLALSAVALGAQRREPSLDAPAPFRVPELSARFIAAQGGTSRIFSADHFGGYLIWKLYPKHSPYIDTRLILRTPEQFGEYLSVVDEPARFDAFAERERFDYVVLPTAYPERYLALIRHLYESEDWRLLVSDGTETLFGRRDRAASPTMNLGDASTTARLLSDIDHRYVDPRVRADARLQLATLQLALGHADQAERALESSDDAQATALRARARLAQGDRAAAGRIAVRALEADPNQVRALNLLAVISIERGEIGKAVGYLRRAARANPFDSETLTILRSLEEKPHDAIN